MLTINKYSINFKSNPEREREMARLAELKRERERLARIAAAEAEAKRERERGRKKLLEKTLETADAYTLNKEEETQLRANIWQIFVSNNKKDADVKVMQNEIKNAVNEAREKLINTILPKSVLYPDVDNEFSKKMAGFFSQFTCAIQNNSEHDLQEFFADEETAQELREKLSPECQHDSLELRKEFQEIVETQDAIMMLMCANKMKNFAPKQGLMNDSQYKKYVEGLKNVIDTIIKNTNLTKFEPDEQNGILEMLQMIKGSQTVDFGISVKLKALVEKINKRKLNLGFIPPVQVKNLETTVKKNINKI